MPPLQFFALPQFRDFTIENNVFELLPGRNDRLIASAVFLGSNLPAGYTPGLHFTTRRAAIRNNIVRYVSTPSGNPVAGYPGDYAFSLKYCEDALVENNSIDLPGASHPLFDQDCKSVRYFNNTSPGGVLRQGESGALWAKRDELTTLVDDALLLGFL